ncbi:hypothetical protein KKHLCK_08060 [Candidatus Electrothrix laxa]
MKVSFFYCKEKAGPPARSTEPEALLMYDTDSGRFCQAVTNSWKEFENLIQLNRLRSLPSQNTIEPSE